MGRITLAVQAIPPLPKHFSVVCGHICATCLNH